LASVDDYLLYRLTGRWVTNPSNAAGMQLAEVATHRWSGELCDLAGVTGEQLSTIQPSATPAGALSESPAAELGLPAGTAVLVGGHDQACAALGLGVVAPGDLLLSAGTAWVLTIVTNSADVSLLPAALNLSAHVVPGCWTASQNLGDLGAQLAANPSTEMFEACASAVTDALREASELAGTAGNLIMVGGGTRYRGLAEVIAAAINRSITVKFAASWPAAGAARLAAAGLGWEPPAEQSTQF